eukprot:CAMPEP_0180696666 /NCGR_PEP_ID=MMETSP1038_2-20121128/3100_1 /TAXON_ID=632150 /ORGANISM="Azadinium spinosum, Strain 3D9" /LENGTH=123 /DNA_ID=CAMNT_0022728159 /DNA_START=78 /DNA_END=446 /DNA_ORIENTATION=-
MQPPAEVNEAIRAGTLQRSPEKVKGGATVVHPSLHNPAELLWNLIIRPPRTRYSPDELGPRHFRVGKRAHGRRTDVVLRNPRGHALQGSFFEPLPQLVWEQSRLASAAAPPPSSCPSRGADSF